MKTFLVFLAMVLVLVSFLTWASDLQRYMSVQSHLKALAEECAGGAALFTDPDAYAQGRLVINETAADQYVRFLIQNAESTPPLAGMNIQAQLSFSGDGTVVTLICTSPFDLFRLPYLSRYEVRRSASYRWQ